MDNVKILIVEDEEINYQLLSIYLKSTNATIIWAKNGLMNEVNHPSVYQTSVIF